MTRPDPCDTCQGGGIGPDGDDCVDCVGTGRHMDDAEWAHAYEQRTGLTLRAKAANDAA